MSYTHLGDSTPKARKRHRCGWCNGPIEIGEKHHAQRSIYDGAPQTWRAHTECLAAFHRANAGQHGDPEDLEQEGPTGLTEGEADDLLCLDCGKDRWHCAGHGERRGFTIDWKRALAGDHPKREATNAQ